MKDRPSSRDNAPANLIDEVFGLDTVRAALPLPLRPDLTPEALVAWLCEGASVSDKLRVRHIVQQADFQGLLSVLDLVWSRKVMAARARKLQLQKQALLNKLRDLEASVLECAPAASFALRDVISLVEESTPLVGAPVFDPSPVNMDAMLDADAGRPRVGRPNTERKEIDVLLRGAGITVKDNRRLILTLLGNK